MCEEGICKIDIVAVSSLANCITPDDKCGGTFSPHHRHELICTIIFIGYNNDKLHTHTRRVWCGTKKRKLNASNVRGESIIASRPRGGQMTPVRENDTRGRKLHPAPEMTSKIQSLGSGVCECSSYCATGRTHNIHRWCIRQEPIDGSFTSTTTNMRLGHRTKISHSHNTKPNTPTLARTHARNHMLPSFPHRPKSKRNHVADARARASTKCVSAHPTPLSHFVDRRTSPNVT